MMDASRSPAPGDEERAGVLLDRVHLAGRQRGQGLRGALQRHELDVHPVALEEALLLGHLQETAVGGALQDADLPGEPVTGVRPDPAPGAEDGGEQQREHMARPGSHGAPPAR